MTLFDILVDYLEENIILLKRHLHCDPTTSQNHCYLCSCFPSQYHYVWHINRLIRAIKINSVLTSTLLIHDCKYPYNQNKLTEARDWSEMWDVNLTSLHFELAGFEF